MPKKCIHENCMKRPIYNISTEKTALYCRVMPPRDDLNKTDLTCVRVN